jgi:YesN/AraC family two-component response regulator
MLKKSLLIVEDDPSIRNVLEVAFNSRYFIFEASTYSDAMKFPSRNIHLAIIDYILPDRDGFEVMRSLREKNPGLPVIIMTGCGNEEVIIRALRKNVADYLKKPLDLKYLSCRVSEILGDEQPREDHAQHTHRENNLDSIAKHIQHNYMEELSLDKLARMACMSRFSFCRAFRERFDQCCISYVNSIRMENAVQLLQDPHFSITEIAFSVGFRNSGHFNRVFKEAHKISPREYRKKITYTNRHLS